MVIGATLSMMVANWFASDPEASTEESSKESDELVTVSEGSYHSEASVHAVLPTVLPLRRTYLKRIFQKKSRFT